MPDNKRKRGKADRRLVASRQEGEVAYMAAKYGVSRDWVRNAIKVVGNNRAKVEALLAVMKGT